MLYHIRPGPDRSFLTLLNCRACQGTILIDQEEVSVGLTAICISKLGKAYRQQTFDELTTWSDGLCPCKRPAEMGCSSWEACHRSPLASGCDPGSAASCGGWLGKGFAAVSALFSQWSGWLERKLMRTGEPLHVQAVLHLGCQPMQH